MAQFPVIGSGPVTLTSSQGTQLSIPLAALIFDGSGINATNWPLYTKFKADVDPWLAYLVTLGELTPGTTTAPPAPAMVISAADPGQAGNNISVTFSNITPDPANPNDPTKTTFDALVVETDAYATLSFDSASPNYIKTVLGTQSATGQQPGLVHALDADNPTQPLAGNYQLQNGADAKGSANAAKAAVAVSGPQSATAFNLEAKKVGAAGNNTLVTITNVDANSKTFSLTAVWSSKPITGIKLADLPNKLQQPGYTISVAAPIGGGGFRIPAAGAISLAGGAGATAATAAQVLVPAG